MGKGVRGEKDGKEARARGGGGGGRVKLSTRATVTVPEANVPTAKALVTATNNSKCESNSQQQHP